MIKNKKLYLKIFPTGVLFTNAYLIINRNKQECFLIDCPAPIEKYKDFIKKKGLKLRFLVITHGHYDHIDGLEDFLQVFSVPFYLHEKDFPMLINPLKNGSLLFKSNPISIKQQPNFCEGGDKIKFGGNHLQIIETPGHTPGSISLKINDWLFSGDLIFYHSVGRTDLPFSNKEQLRESIIQEVFILDSGTLIYPGHGKATNVREELENNPFFN